jgi:hypothetical protein
LRDEVAKLKEERDRANAGFRGFVNRIGPAVGLIVAVFAIPRGLKDSWDTILSGPETSIVPSTDVTMSYDSTARTLSFGFDLTMVNNGLKTDAIRDLTGKFELGTKKLSVPSIVTASATNSCSHSPWNETVRAIYTAGWLPSFPKEATIFFGVQDHDTSRWCS